MTLKRIQPTACFEGPMFTTIVLKRIKAYYYEKLQSCGNYFNLFFRNIKICGLKLNNVSIAVK